MSDHPRIYLEPLGNVDPHGDGSRQWCQDNVWPDDEGGEPGVAYIRTDLVIDVFRQFVAHAWPDHKAQDEAVRLFSAALSAPPADDGAQSITIHENSGDWGD